MEEKNKQISVGRIDLRGFREGNSLLQKDIANYLGVSMSFISQVEKGTYRLPEEQLIKLMENDMNWDTDYLFGIKKSKSERLRNEIQSFTNNGVNFGGDANAPVNNYSGYSEEAFQKELARRMEIHDYEVRHLKEENEKLRAEIARERALLTEEKKTSSRYLSIIEHLNGIKVLPEESRVIEAEPVTVSPSKKAPRKSSKKAREKKA